MLRELLAEIGARFLDEKQKALKDNALVELRNS